MKKRIPILLCAILLAGCSSFEGANVFVRPSVNMLEITWNLETYDLSQSAVTVADRFYKNGAVVIDPMTNMFYGEGGRVTERKNMADIDLNMLVYFTENGSSLWEMNRGKENIFVEIPNAGVQQFLYSFTYREERGGSLAGLTMADGITQNSTIADLSGYVCTGMFGRSMANTSINENTHYLMVTVDGEPIDVKAYEEQVPESWTRELAQKEGLLNYGSFFTQMLSAYTGTDKANWQAHVDEHLKNDQEYRLYAAAILAAYDQVPRLNNREIKNFTIIDVSMTAGRINSVTYMVHQYDTYTRQ